MNNCNFTAHAGADAETRYGGTENKPIVTVNVALKTGFGQKAKTHWSKLTIFGKQAEWLGEIRKGNMILVSGAQYEVEEWTTKDGEKRKTHSFVAGYGSDVQIIESPTRNKGNDSSDFTPADTPPATTGDNDGLPF